MAKNSGRSSTHKSQIAFVPFDLLNEFECIFAIKVEYFPLKLFQLPPIIVS